MAMALVTVIAMMRTMLMAMMMTTSMEGMGVHPSERELRSIVNTSSLYLPMRATITTISDNNNGNGESENNDLCGKSEPPISQSRLLPPLVVTACIIVIVKNIIIDSTNFTIITIMIVASIPCRRLQQDMAEEAESPNFQSETL